MHTPKCLGDQIWQMNCSGRPSPPFKTARAESELFGVQWRKWEPIWNSQLIRKYKEIPVQIYKDTDTKGRWTPPFDTARAESELFGVQWCKWEPIRNSQLIIKYKEIPVQIYRDTDTKGRWTPWSTLSEHRVISSLFNVVIETQRQMDPPGFRA